MGMLVCGGVYGYVCGYIYVWVSVWVGGFLVRLCMK